MEGVGAVKHLPAEVLSDCRISDGWGMLRGRLVCQTKCVRLSEPRCACRSKLKGRCKWHLMLCSNVIPHRGARRRATWW